MQNKEDQKETEKSMENKVVYIKPKRNAEVTEEEVRLKDIASVTCTDELMKARIKMLKIHRFGEKTEKRVVVSGLKLIELIQNSEKQVTVENVGEQDTLIKLVKMPDKKGFAVWMKVVFVALISFFGTAFTIMAFHNDVGIHDVFSNIYKQILGTEAEGLGILEATYSLGLAVGIVIFFNHIGGRRITVDPTPIEVEMRIYEKDVDDTLIETADREGKSIDAS